MLMRSDNTNTIKRNISLALILFSIALNCAAFDVSIDTLGTGGSITGKRSVPFTNFLTSVINSGSGEDNNEEDLRQNPEKKAALSNLISNTVRSTIYFFSDWNICEQLIHSCFYCLSICTLCCVCLFRRILIRIINLKDGSK